MHERIAEFDSMCDAHDFMRLKNRAVGEDAYTVCGGLHMMWAVRPLARRLTNLGNPESPPESHVDEPQEREYEHEDYYE